MAGTPKGSASMSLRHWGFIYTAPEIGPDANVTVVETPSCRSVFVGVADLADAVEAALRLVDDGAQLIEVCGAYGPVWAGRIIEATGHRVPVGAVTYGAEAVEPLHRLFATP
jgi:Family of unknown function (DUF6506)